MQTAAKSVSKVSSSDKQTRRRKAKVRQHRLGHYIIRDKGKDVYLGLSFGLAQQQAVALLGEDKVILQAWPPKKNPAGERRWVARTVKEIEATTKPAIQLRTRTFSEAAAMLLKTLRPDQTEGRKHLNKTLGVFLEIFGKRGVQRLSGEDLLKFRAALASHLSPKTQNHHVASTRRLLTFIYDPLGWVDVPYRVGGLTAAPLPPAPDKALPIERIREILTRVGKADLNLARWLLLQFYTVGRTSEMPKLIHRRGEFEPKYPFVFRLARGKTDLQTGEPTRIILIPEAMRLLEVVEPQFNNEDRYQKACRRMRKAELERVAGSKPASGTDAKAKDDWSPGLLRASASTYLADSGVDSSLIRVAEHHAEERVIRVYRPPPYAKVREAMGVLAKAVPAEVVLMS